MSSPVEGHSGRTPELTGVGLVQGFLRGSQDSQRWLGLDVS